MRGILFDMDGTMFDTEQISVQAIRQTTKKYGVFMDDETLFGLFGLPSEEGRRIYLDKFGEDFDYAGYRQDKILCQNAIIEKNGVPIKPGLPELLQYAKENNILCAVATSTSRERTDDLLSRANVESFFSAIICGEDVKSGKPNPDIFLCAAEKLGLKPEECMVIEDSRNGILAASASGSFSILIPDLVPVTEEMAQAADIVCDSLFDVLEYIKKGRC